MGASRSSSCPSLSPATAEVPAYWSRDQDQGVQHDRASALLQRASKVAGYASNGEEENERAEDGDSNPEHDTNRRADRRDAFETPPSRHWRIVSSIDNRLVTSARQRGGCLSRRPTALAIRVTRVLSLTSSVEWQ